MRRYLASRNKKEMLSVNAPAFVRIEPPGPPVAKIPLPLAKIPRLHTNPDHGPLKRNILIIGSQAAGRGLATYLKQHPAAKCAVRGFLDDSETVGGDVLGRVADLAGIARAQFVDDVILTPPHQRELVSRVILEAERNHLGLKVVPDLFGVQPESVVFDKVGDLPVLSLRQERIPAVPMFLKRIADIVVSALLLAVVSPLLAAIALAIRLTSSGTVLYRAPRVGKKGRTFRCCKFRTMVANADQTKHALRRQNEHQGPTFKLAHDPRITSVGRVLRRYSLDELPQLWNVLRGEMSLVGPRPHPLDDFEHYALDHLRRLNATPGMTGLWQVTARNDPSFRRNLELDLEYIEHWSLWLDLRILCKTFSAVLQGSGT
jgi:exopolysaccharide biosynthesis polyprenyl glycosylphosphotransferase